MSLLNPPNSSHSNDAGHSTFGHSTFGHSTFGHSTFEPSARSMPGVSAAAAVYEQWTQRVAAQGESVSARELAGLTDEELSSLACEFVQAPHRRRTDRLRFAIPIGTSICAVAALGMLIHFGLLRQSDAAASTLLLFSIGAFVTGVVAICIGSLSSYGLATMEMTYGKLGLYVTVLDEHHPWLYTAFIERINPAAEAYRCRVLRERGSLRGIDCVMMREIAKAHENLELTQSARSIAVRLQQVEETHEGPSTPQERRLVSIHTPDAQSVVLDRGERRASSSADVRSFGNGTPQGGAFG